MALRIASRSPIRRLKIEIEIEIGVESGEERDRSEPSVTGWRVQGLPGWLKGGKNGRMGKNGKKRIGKNGDRFCAVGVLVC